jgi:hypothetical protein
LTFEHHCYSEIEASSNKREQLRQFPPHVEWHGMAAARVMGFASLLFLLCSFTTLAVSFDEIVKHSREAGPHAGTWLFIIFIAAFFIAGGVGRVLGIREREAEQAEYKIDRELERADFRDLKQLPEFVDIHPSLRDSVRQWNADGKVIRARDVWAIHAYVGEQNRIAEKRNQIVEHDAVMAKLSGL